MQIYNRKRFFAWTDFETTGLAEMDRPIEVAIVVTDEALVECSRLQTLLVPARPELFISSSMTPDQEAEERRKNAELSGEEKVRGVRYGHQWFPNATGAYEVHGISADEVIAAIPNRIAVQRMIDFLEPFHNPILVSDNPVFEERMGRAMFRDAGLIRKWPFHYNCWSPLMLCAAWAIERPIKGHRAMADVEGMLAQTRKAGELIDQVLGDEKPGPLEAVTTEEPDSEPAWSKARPMRSKKSRGGSK